MVFYFCSQTYQHVVSKAISEKELICAGSEVGEQIYLCKYIKENISHFSGIEILIVDLTALADTDVEIIEAIENIRNVGYDTRFIILSPRRWEGDSLLKECFNRGIYDMIATDDYSEIYDELMECLAEGRKYKDAVRFRDAIAVKPEGQQNKVVNRVVIAVAGVGGRRGATHTSIVLANFLRKKKFMVAVAELSATKAFRAIAEEQKAKIFDESYFKLQGIDYYPECDEEKLRAITGKAYNFIVLDMGNYFVTDKVSFNKSDVRVIVSGSKPWEIYELNNLFAEQVEIVMKDYHFCFTFAHNPQLQRDIIDSMKPFENIYFPEYSENPLESDMFAEANEILKEYLDNVIVEKKKGISKLFERKK